MLLSFVAPNLERQASAAEASNVLSAAATSKPLASALSAQRWQQVENSVDRALAWMAARQAADGSFPTIPQGQPAVTSLSVMAFLSRGYQPGAGPYGKQLDKAVDFVLACQLPDGLLCKLVPGPVYQNRQASHTAVYNHAISGLLLGEVYGQVTGPRARNVKKAIDRALEYTRQMQARPKSASDKGGWRYVRTEPPADSDLSITAWQLMFLRSAKNAEFDVPQEQIDEAMAYVRHCWDPASRMFLYALPGSFYGASRGTVGAGIVSLSMGGQHQTAMALAAGDWLLAHPFRVYGETVGMSTTRDKFIYDAYYCSQAAAQLGGRYWEGVFPAIVQVLLAGQSPGGSWPATPDIAVFGDELMTALAVLSLTPPYQLLPVYQR